MKIEDLDPLLIALSEEYGVPKPNYCIFQVSALKKLDPLFSDPKYGVTITRSGGGGWEALPLGASFHPDDRYGFITLLVRKKGQIRREAIVHEFFHYLHWIQGKYKIKKKLKTRGFYEFFWKLLNGKTTEDTLEDIIKHFAERHEEERITKRETRKWLREHPLPKS